MLNIVSSYQSGAVAAIATSGLLMNLDPDNVASYPGSGTVITDLSGNGNDATLVNGVGYGSTPLGYLNYDGVDDYLQCFTPSLTRISIEIYLNMASFTNDIFYIGGVEGSYRILVFDTSIGWICATSTANWYSPGTAIDTNYTMNGNWVHVVGTFDGDKNRLYINGVLQATGSSIGGNIIATGSLTFMRSWAGGILYGREKQGAIRLYNRALSAAEVTGNFNATKSRYGL